MYSKRENLSVWKRTKSHFLCCARISSVHGVAHIVRPNVSPFERVLWALLVLSAVGWSITLGLEALDHYQTRPTVISVERDHWNWNVTFPSTTICFDALHTQSVDKIIRELNITDKKERSKFPEFLEVLAFGKFDNYSAFANYSSDSIYFQVDKYVEWVVNSRAPFDPNQFTQKFGEVREFVMTLSEHGLCYTYNSEIAVYNSYEYWLNNTLELVPTPPALMVNPSISKPAAILMELTAGYKIFFHGYNELPDYYSTPINIPAATASKFQLTLSDLSTSPEVKDLQVSQRHCRLTSEGNLQYTPVYSHHLCFMECRMKVYLRVCNCTPYYFRRLGPDPICNPAGMNCLFKNLEEIEALGISSCHGCDTNCDEYVFTIDSVETTDWFLGTNVEWDLIKYPEIRYKRSLIFSGSNLIVQFGGATGLLLGASVLSLAEIVFFVTLRFCWCVFGKRQVD